MKTTVKVIFRAIKDKPEKGMLALRITGHRVARVILTPYVLFVDEWDEKLQKTACPKKSSPPVRKEELDEIDERLKKDLELLTKAAEMLEVRGDYSSQDLVNCFHKQKEGQLFCEYIERIVNRLTKASKFGTAQAYFYAAVSFRKFLGGKDIGINKINSELIRNYENYLKAEHKSKNTISCYMRSLRAAYNQAIMEKVLIVEESKSKPFSGTFTGNAKTSKRAAGEEDISKLAALVLDPAHSIAFSRDLFLFCFFTQGMSYVDAANLKKENIRNGFIRYNRKKTDQLITIQLENCMKTIIKRYASHKSDYIFPILRQYQDCDEYTKWRKTVESLAIHNRNLNKLAKLAGIEKHLTSYVARHSWASIASQEGVPLSTISRGMGHESEKTTRIYISQLDSSDVGRANHKILSHFEENSSLPVTANWSR